MTPTTFHYFPKLPKQVKDTIWALAVRPERPSAHFFTVYTDFDAESSLLSQYTTRHPETLDCNLAAPQAPTSDNDNQERQFSWVRGNRSAYLMDAGLWTACRESRAAMEQRFEEAGWTMMPEQDGKWIVEGSVRKYIPGLPDTSYFFSGGEWQRCLTYPKSDLFVVQPFDIRTLKWRYVFGFPVYSRIESFKNDVAHIALDYGLANSLWEGPGSKCIIEALTGGLPFTDRLWFVDYSLRRRVSIPPLQNRHQFHGNGCVFTEVQDGDMGWYHDWESRADKGEGESEEDKGVSVYGFLWNLELKVTQVLNEEDVPSPEYTPFGYHPVCNKPTVDILAYEECNF